MPPDDPPNRSPRAAHAETITFLGEERGTAVTAAASGDQDRPAPSGPILGLPDRYEDLRGLGSGGFGEVRRVRDRKLDRIVAMKFLRTDLRGTDGVRARFLAEVKLTASLQHPGIVAIHDYGELSDGRLWYTMLEVRGRTLRSILSEMRLEADDGAAPRRNRRRLLDFFARVCETVAYAHRHGVIHRDLKPENVMVGEFGQVMVMDWGIARRYREPPDSDERAAAARGGVEPNFETADTPALTQHGDVLGTPAYMAPEQARGEIDQRGPTADVYSLGAILFDILAGRPPFETFGSGAWRKLRKGDTPRLSQFVGLDVPGELVLICERAMHPKPEGRHADAAELGAEITAFLDGVRRREKALEELGRANVVVPTIAELRVRAADLRRRAKDALATVRPSDPVSIKSPGWQLEDEAERHEREAILLETTWIQRIHGALTLDPELPEAHEVLADHYKERLLDAERSRAEGEAARLEVLLRAHDRGRHAAILTGMGVLTLVTEPAVAQVTLYRYAYEERRLIPERMGDLGLTPILGLPLDRGSYLLRIEAPGRAPVAYPVLIERDAHWDGVPPGDAEPRPILLPPEGELGPDDVYVPDGYCMTGGDPEAADSLPARRVWVDGFVMRRFPVTNLEYIAFLDDLVDTGREAEAIAACPRSQLGLADGAESSLAFRRNEAGHFVLGRVGSGPPWEPDWPVVLVDWFAASAYARWLAERTGQPWRLGSELEREKAARGVDGRACPWGDHLEPTFASVLEAYRNEPARAGVDSYPSDESPYGVRGLAGNVRDWCINAWRSEGPRIDGDRAHVDAAASGDEDFRTIKGGGWASSIVYSRSAARFGGKPGLARPIVGFRVVRSFPVRSGDPLP